VPVSGPTVERRFLGRRLRAVREAAGVTAEQVEHARLASRTKLWRIEKGRVRITVPDVWALCRFYGATRAETDELAAMAEGTTDRGPWYEYRHVVPEWFRLFIGLEAAATGIDTFDDSVVPGELQTPEYARALWLGAWPHLTEQDVAPHLALRRQRQESLFSRVPAPRLTVVVGENVLRRQVGGTAVLAAQVDHLRRLSALGNVGIGYLPFTAGAHPAVTGAFRILRFDDPENPDLVYVESETEARYLEKPSEVAHYRSMFAVLTERALPVAGFRA
jgi:transcriptional regulator with XRE-family HTH domain